MAFSKDGGTSLSCPRLPPELWSMIINWLLLDQHPRQLSSLARVARAFYQEINPLIYKSVWLKTHYDNGPFTRTLIERPDLAARIRELRHDDDHGSKFTETDSLALYKELEKLDNVETMVMRLREEAYDGNIDPNAYTIHAGAQHADSPVPGPLLSRPGEVPDPSSIASSLWYQDFFTRTPHYGFPSLRSCHIGSDYLSFEAQTGMAGVPESVFWHPTLEELCITNGVIRSVEEGQNTTCARPLPYSTALKELKLLNTNISPADLHRVLGYPKALKKLTYRGMEPILQDQWPQMDGDIPMDSYQEAILPQREHLEVIDLDLYWSELDWEDLSPFTSLKDLIITPYVLTGPDTPDSLRFEEIEFPRSIESLTFRYEKGETGLPIAEVLQKVEAGELPNLKSFVIEMPEHLDMRKGANICIAGIERVVTFIRSFKELGIKFQVPAVPYPKRMPSYKVCSCERMEYYHRFVGHTPDYIGESEAGDYSPMRIDDPWDGEGDELDYDHQWDASNDQALGGPVAQLYDRMFPPGTRGSDRPDPDTDETEL